MKLIDSWKDYEENVIHYYYEFPNGLRVLHTIHPKTIEFSLAICVKSGSYYESQINVPYGTAHFLEHIITNNPNSKFKSREEMEEFAFGTRKRPGFSYGAWTNNKYNSYWANGNEKAAPRILKLVLSQINYPIENTKEYIERERGIILAELQRKNKEEKDSGYVSNQFIYGEKYPEFVSHTLGTEETIKNMNVEDLTKYYNKVYSKSNFIITTCSNSKLDKKTIDTFKKFDKEYTNNTKVKLKDRHDKIVPEFKFKHFKDERQRGVFFSMNMLVTENFKKIDYYFRRHRSTAHRLMWLACHELLRERLNLVYGVERFNYVIGFSERSFGIKMQCEKDLFLEVLNKTHDAISDFYWEYLNSSQGKAWLESVISEETFKINKDINTWIGSDTAFDILDKNPVAKFDNREWLKVSKIMTNESIKEVYEKLLSVKPIFWFESPYEDKEIYTIFKKSKFFKKYK